MKTRSNLTTALLLLFFNLLFSQNFEAIDSLANLVMHKYDIKGIAMVGVKNDKIVYSKGFGRANETYEISEETPLYIASNTKAFVGLAMLKLINEGQLSLEDQLLKHIDKKFFSKEISLESITIKDLLSHNTGLSNDPLTFRTSSSGEYPKDLQELLKYTVYKSENSNLEKNFWYSNLGYLLCGIVIENITGKTWREYLEEEIIPILGLENTQPHMPTGNRGELMAMPYVFKKQKPLKLVKEDNTLHAAGGLFTDLKDMGKWLTFFTSNDSSIALKENKLKGYNDRLIETEDSFGPISIEGYGYGWYKGNIVDLPINFHAGGFSGHNSFMSYLPENNIGFFIYMNENSNLRLAALQMTFLFYHIVTGNDNLKKTLPTFTKRVQSVYDNFESDSLMIINPSVKSLPIGIFKNDKYGTLKIYNYNDHYEITLGLNLRSKAYKADGENDIRVQFIPGSNVHFTFEGKDEDLKIKYGKDYGYFTPITKDKI